jgi:hypothetical protein
MDYYSTTTLLSNPLLSPLGCWEDENTYFISTFAACKPPSSRVLYDYDYDYDSDIMAFRSHKDA